MIVSQNGLTFKKITNDFNVSASVYIDTKLYSFEIFAYTIEYFFWNYQPSGNPETV